MKFESLREYLLEKKGAYEDFPFGPTAIVFKVMGKMFALVPLDETPPRINLKCDPELALHLREAFEAVLPGYHMNKRHWNTVVLDGSIPDKELISMIDDSYNLVLKGLKRADRLKLEGSARKNTLTN
jgi:predicted DNA-binding protein (MmcQ/YjbR family)